MKSILVMPESIEAMKAVVTFLDSSLGSNARQDS
jgi:hypothetical protein